MKGGEKIWQVFNLEAEDGRKKVGEKERKAYITQLDLRGFFVNLFVLFIIF